MSEIQPPYRYLSFSDQSVYRRYAQQNKQPFNKPLHESSATEAPAHGSYGALLLHPKWKAKRQEILVRDIHRCVHCSNDQDLQVHHRQYHFIIAQQKFRLPWEYPNSLLITLCQSCHNKGHNKYKVPTINI